jgi:hypothetical protein
VKKYLADDEIHAIINQMEVTMSMNAAELVDVIVEKRARAEQRAFTSLKQKIVDATALMVSEMALSTEVEVSDDDLLALTKVTESLRDLGYKFRFIEVQDSSGETIKHKLYISVEHLSSN